jgi:hypothetical protein
MRAERALFVATGFLLVAVIALCWVTANIPQSYSGSGTDSGIPWPIVWAQITSTAASTFALVGLASAAGLLFLRAARWTGLPVDDDGLTQEPSP